MIDTHCHLYNEEFDTDIDTVIENAFKNNVTKFYLPAIDSTYIERMNLLEKKYRTACFSMAGLHPCYVKENYKDELEQIKSLLKHRKFCGIGETGLDFYWDKTFVKQQYESLHAQIELALENGLPLILHTRDATEETIEVVKKYENTNLTGIFHCFGGSLEQANKIINLGFYLGIGGVVTYKNASLAKVLENVAMENIVLETDAPYLTPVPFRGKRNESGYLKYIAEKIAEIKNISVAMVDEITTQNAEKIFGI
ncbi:MAG: TatD family hydrolase [Ferruginibacter sp.]|nr:TatD family hydrolase [Ferruginibacter sp.]